MYTIRPMLWINVLFLAALIGLGSLVGCAPAATGSVKESQVGETTGDITVIGRGEALGEPDKAQVQIGVETFAAEAGKATSENEATLQAILATLDEQGIAAENIQTSNYSLWAEQLYGDNGPEGIAGYRVSNQVAVTIWDIDKVDDILAAVTEAGANSIYGVNFSVADPATLEAEAREKAINDARQRASSLAELSGIQLGEIRAISEVIGQMPGPYFDMGAGGAGGAMESAAPSISPGQLSYKTQLQVTFEIAK